MRVRIVRMLSLVSLSAILSAMSMPGQVAVRTPATAGRLAPAFSASTTGGQRVSLADYRGKVLLLEFWASWCAVCEADLPAVRQIHDRYSAKGFTVLAISMDQDAGALRAKVAEKQLPWPQIMDGLSFAGELPKLYGVQSTPAYFVLDRGGRVALRTADSNRLEDAVVKALAPPSDSSSNRDAWQRPAYVMDELGLKTGSNVADVGAGDGYFTLHLAERVGREGRVYAVDINESVLEGLNARAVVRGYDQVVTVLGATDDPRLPEAALDAILVVNAFHEMKAFDEMLGAMYRALKPGGRLAIIDAGAESGKIRSQYQKDHHIPESVVREDAVRNGFTFRNRGDDFRMSGSGHAHDWYFLVFTR